MTQIKTSFDVTKYTDPVVAGFSKYVTQPVGGALMSLAGNLASPEVQKQREAAAAALLAARNQELGSNVLRGALGGLGVGLSGAGLYHLIQSMTAPVKNTHVKFGPGAKELDENEKIAGTLEQRLQQLYSDASGGIGNALSTLFPFNSEGKSTATIPAVLGATSLGLLGGSSLVNTIEKKRRKEEQDEMVEEAKKEYQRTLMGRKYASDFDAAFAAYTEKRAEGTWAGWVAKNYLEPLRLIHPDMPGIYLTGVLGTGALASKMTYDWTRARSKDKALEKARKSRARIEGAAPLYIDPEQLAAIKKIAD